MKVGERALAILVASGIGCATWVGWHFTVDDAWIVARVAMNIAQGHGYAFNPGQPSDAVTGPLWLLPLVVAEWVHLSPVVAAKSVSLFCTLLAVGIACRWGCSHGLSRQALWIALVAMVVQGNLWIWSAAGLETGAATLCVTMAMTAATSPQSIRIGSLAISVFALAWLRPEALVIGGIAVGIAMFRHPTKGCMALCSIGLGVATVCLFRASMFGHWLPLSVYAKPASTWHAVQYTWLGVVILTSGFGAALIAWVALQGEPPFRLGALGVTAHLLAILLCGGDWMPGFRLFVPVLPLYAVLVAAGWDMLRHKHVALAAMVVTLSAVVPALDAVVQLPRVQQAGTLQAQRGAMLGHWLRTHVKSAALVDVGRVGLNSPLELIDLVGLTDATVAFSPGPYLAKRIDVAYLAIRQPEAIVLRLHAWDPIWGWNVPIGALQSSTEAWLLAEPWVRLHYRLAKVMRYTDRYIYLVLIKRPQAEHPAAMAASAPWIL